MAFKIVPDWISTPNTLTLTTVLVVLVAWVATFWIKRRKFVTRVNKVPGTYGGGYNLLGDASNVMSLSSEELFRLTVSFPCAIRDTEPIHRVWAGPFPLFFLYTVEAFETVLSSNKLIEKSREYDFLHPWLSTGLLTSSGNKWFTRRKMLTPTFHFKILEDFVQVFNEQTDILITRLTRAAEEMDDFNIYPFITRCTLDIICETAMGCNVQAQTKTDSDYVNAIYTMSRVVQLRQSRPFLQPELFFQLSSYGAEQRKSLKVLHTFTDKVIQDRKLEYKRNKNDSNSVRPEVNQDDLFISKKKRLAFLDLLIEASKDGTILSDTDIREEVDTFMFEGHDTTTAGINWSLFLIGSDPKVQEQIQVELNRVFGDSSRPITMADLTELKYLECCIKEALRLYPSVPIMGRKLSEDVNIHGYDVPANTTVLLLTYLLHRDPKHFPDPELYKPERFFAENTIGRHPYAYVPFSAGSRNCIGQKFALMEEKIILASIFRNFYVKSLDKRDELILLGELILRPRDGIRLRLTPKIRN